MYVVAALTLIASCSGDDSGNEAGSGGSGGASGAGSGANGGSSGQGGGGASGANGGDGGASGAAGAGAGGDGGSSGGGTGGDGATDGGGGEMDSGTDSGVPGNEFACVAPTPSTDFGEECPAADPVALQLTPLRTDLDVAIFVTHAPGDESRLFVAQRGGQILILDPANGETIGTFLDISGQATTGTSGGHEYGLLGLAFHPNYPEDPRIFLNYTIDGYTTDDEEFSLETIVSSFEVSDDANVIDMSSEQILVRFGQPQDNHNGGMLAFGKDNCLYVGTGDGGNFNDTGGGHSPGGNGQDLSKPLGKILRVDQDNPSVRAPGNPEGPEYQHIWDYGIRNPWRFSFDRDTGDMYIGDVGQNDHEEVSVAPRGVGNNNFGWPIMEGFSCFGGGCDMNGLVLPASDYDNVEGDNCVIGGYVYRGAAIPTLQGWYVYGDSGSMRRIRAFVWDGETACETPIMLSERDGLALNARITSFGEDAAGELYVVTSAGLYRFDEAE
jgi:glucose/arabinose dehydrogenase